jgi:hypothetical protein
MSTDVQSLLAALFTQEGKRPAVATSTAPPPLGARPKELPLSGANAEALKHYQQALQALSKGDWRSFGAEMDALQKTLQGGKGGGPPG